MLIMKKDIKEIDNDIDLRLILMSGDPLCADGVVVEPLNLHQIKNVGYLQYNKYLSILTLEKKDIVEDVANYDGLTLLDIVLASKNEIIINAFADGLCLFLGEQREHLVVTDKAFMFGVGDTGRPVESCKIVTSENFGDIVQILKYQNCLVSGNETYTRINPADDRARRIAEKFKRSKEIIDSIKSNSQDVESQNIDFADIISAVSTKSYSYDKKNIWRATVYQLYDEYRRLEMISGYETSIMAMVQGAKIENLKHWSAKIE